jgi:quercetin dioxygenase-like cupin family protein
MRNRMHIVRAALVVACLALGSAGLAQQTPDSPVMPLKKSAVGALDKRIEIVHGDRTKPGEPFVIRIHAEAGYIIMPHTHPVDENIVVVEGSWALGMGEHFRKELLAPMEVGDYGFAARNMAHFAFSKTDTVLQVHGIGPFSVKWVVPVYELTAQGVLMKAMAEDPGQLVTNVPHDCFALKLGTSVRGSYGEGVIIGAQCTPSELTQYRIEKKDGQRFWAQRDQLQTL